MLKKIFPKQVVVLFLLIFVLFVSVKSTEAAKVKIRVVTDKADIKLRPEANALVIMQAAKGTVYEAEEKVGDWFRVNLPPDASGVVVTGYIFSYQVEIVQEQAAQLVTSQAAVQRASSPSPYGQSANSSGIGLGFKFGGGLGLLFNGGGDLEQARLGQEEYYADIGGITGYTTTFNWKKMSMVPNFEADLILTFGRNFGFGIGSGYITGTNKGDLSWTWDYTANPWWGTYTIKEKDIYALNYSLSAIPIRFTLYFFLPMNSMTFYGFGGLGYYMGKLNADFTDVYTYNYSDSSWYYWNEKEEYTFNQTVTEKSTANALGFHGGVGLKMNLSPSVGIAFELFGRLVNFTKWTGDASWNWNDRDRWWHELYGWYYDDTGSGSGSETGTLWYYEYHDSYFNKDYADIYLSEHKPTGYRNVREAAINLNAFGVAVSLMFHFNLF